ncbi:MAG TPA: hypothetical protein DCS67_07670 [Clostridiales bacterium UBA8960]|nr:hypothetical protein [Clostridiales bacterium UBA8960]
MYIILVLLTVLLAYYAVSYSRIRKQLTQTEEKCIALQSADEEAKKNLSRLKSLLDNSPSAIVIIDDHGRFVEVSAVAEKIMGLPKEEIVDKEITQIAPPDMVKKALYVLSQSEIDGQFLESIDVFEFEGNKRYFESRVFPLHDSESNENLYGYLGIDVTDRITAEHALKESEEKYSGYIEHAPYGVFIVDENGRYVEVNKCACAITGYSKEQLLMMSLEDITAKVSLDFARSSFENLKKVGYMKWEFEFVHQNGSIRWCRTDAVKITEDRYLIFAIDMTDEKASEEKLLYIVNHDSLTGLYNRRFYEQTLKLVDVPEQLPLSIIIGDINGLKLINDSFGNLEGDKVIKETARLMESCCREGDVLTRTGGDEFTILLPNTNYEAAVNLLNDIQYACKQYNIHVKNEACHIKLSLGVDTKETVHTSIMQVSKMAED